MTLFLLLGAFGTTIYAESGTNFEAENNYLGFEPDAKSVVLMEANTGTLIYAKNKDSAYSPASVTKVMTLLLVVEAIREEAVSLDDKITVSKHAASMGGSQVFLSEGESFTLEELLKCTVIASANDAAVALAEHVAGSEEAFVSKMNARAVSLGLSSTWFENVTGLDDDTVNHVTSAHDIAIMSCELLKYDIITKYSSLWQDSIRNGEFILTNTNRLVRYYDGCNGLKTGSTDKAGYCISVSAKRDGMQLVAVIMGAPTRDSRNESARKLLDYGFSSYAIFAKPERYIADVSVQCSKEEIARAYGSDVSVLIKKEELKNITETIELLNVVKAPLKANEPIGRVKYTIGERTIAESKVYLKNDIDKMTFFNTYTAFISSLFKFK